MNDQDWESIRAGYTVRLCTEDESSTIQEQFAGKIVEVLGRNKEEDHLLLDIKSLMTMTISEEIAKQLGIPAKYIGRHYLRGNRKYIAEIISVIPAPSAPTPPVVSNPISNESNEEAEKRRMMKFFGLPEYLKGMSG